MGFERQDIVSLMLGYGEVSGRERIVYKSLRCEQTDLGGVVRTENVASDRNVGGGGRRKTS